MSAKEQVVVLHLSDLHFGWEGDENGRANRNLALSGLLRLLGKLDRSWQPDCVCISGDIGWGGRPNDYKDAQSWIEKLLKQLKLSPDALFMCPGNHDANRVAAQGNARPSSPEEADRVLGIPIQEHYLKPFAAYIEFCKTIGVPPYALGPNTSYLVGLRSFQSINFVAYNSAWSSKDNNDEGKLWLGLPHMRHMEIENQLPNPEQIAEWPPIIAFFHHPFESFHPEERHAWKQRPNTFDYMARRCHLFFTGHIHAEARDADLVGGGAWHLDGGAAYAGASHFNFFRIVQVRADRFIYRSFVFDPSSPDNAWQEKGEAKPLVFKALTQKGASKNSSSTPESTTEKPSAPQSGLHAVSAKVEPLLAEMSFLSFFPEGLLAGLYRHLVIEKGLEAVDERAQKEGLVRLLDSEGPKMVSADRERMRELHGLIKDPANTAKDVLSSVRRWVDESGVFVDMVGLGIGRAMLLRDLLALAQIMSAAGNSNNDLQPWACRTARAYLPDVAKQHPGIGVEIGEGLLAADCMRTATDNLMLAHLLLLMGEAGKAADLFEAYRGSDLFDHLGLSEIERFNFALDWAKATKDIGRARPMHAELVKAYQRMLQLLRHLPTTSKEEEEVARNEADVLNNNATQIAQFGEDAEWTEAQKSFTQIYDIYTRLKDNDRLLGARANFVAHSLDRLEKQTAKAPEKKLRALFASLEELNGAAQKSKASENVFFFLYQKGRLLKRLYPEDPARAGEYYKQAREVAERASLHQRAAIARCWELRLQRLAGEISESVYLKGLQQCATSLRPHTDNVWASRALINALLDIARILRNEDAMSIAWDSLAEAFDLEARLVWSQSSSTASLLKKILKAMDSLNPEEDKKASFLEKNAPLLKQLTGAPEYKRLEWSVVVGWLK
jgi:predicted phosphohydrolase